MVVGVEWFVLTLRSASEYRAVEFELRQQVRRAQLAGRIPADARVYVVTDADAVRLLANRAAVNTIELLERLPREASAPPAEGETGYPLIGD